MKGTPSVAGICSICRSEKSLVCHHLSYDPEITIFICRMCHRLLHWLAKVPKDLLPVYLRLVGQYGDLWEDGYQKYLLTKRHREIVRKNNKARIENGANRKSYDKHKDVLKEKRTQRRLKYKINKLCYDCGKSIDDGGSTIRCLSCLTKIKTRKNNV